MSRRQIWAKVRTRPICERAGVSLSNVFPHYLRHPFGRTVYKVCRDVVRPVDVLGCSRAETTRTYLEATGVEQQRRKDCLEPEL